MKQITLLAAAAIVSLGSVVSANATVVTFSSLGGADPLYLVPPGETLYTDFSAGLPAGASGNGKIYTPKGSLAQPGDNPGTDVAAPYTPTGSTKGKFFAVTPTESETFKFGKLVSDVDVYIGSVDQVGNVFTLMTTSGNQSWTGAQLGLVTGAPLPAEGTATITGKTSNGRFLFVDGSADIIGFSITETNASKTNSFEIAQITTSTSIPEASTWAMLALGFGGLGVTAFRKSRKPVSEIA